MESISTREKVPCTFEFRSREFANLPTLLTSPLRHVLNFCPGFWFCLHEFDVTLPHPAFDFGHNYTVARYFEFVRESANNPGFETFAEKLWENAASKNDLAQFFEQYEEVKL